MATFKVRIDLEIKAETAEHAAILAYEKFSKPDFINPQTELEVVENGDYHYFYLQGLLNKLTTVRE